MGFDRFDVCRAYYWFAYQYHGGQWTEEYAIFGRLDKLGFRPSRLDNGPQRDIPEDENCRMILADIVQKYREQQHNRFPLTYGRN